MLLPVYAAAEPDWLQNYYQFNATFFSQVYRLPRLIAPGALRNNYLELNFFCFLYRDV